MKYVEYNQPTDASCRANEIVRVPVEEAIRIQRAAGMQRAHMYGDDQSALDDYITTNWGWVVDIPAEITYDGVSRLWTLPERCWLMKLRFDWPSSILSCASSRWVLPSGHSLLQP